MSDWLIGLIAIYGLPALFIILVAAQAGVPMPMTLLLVIIGSLTEQGQLQGANASIASLAGIFAPALFATVFSATLERLPGAAFLLAALCLLAALAIGWRVTRP